MLRRLGLYAVLLFAFALCSCDGDLSDLPGDIDVDIDGIDIDFGDIDWGDLPEIDKDAEEEEEGEIPDTDKVDEADQDPDPVDVDKDSDVEPDADADIETDEDADEDVVETQGCGNLQVPETFVFQDATVGQVASGLIEITNQPSEGANGPTVTATQFEFLENPMNVFSIMNVPPIQLPSEAATSLNVICLMTLPGQYTGRLKITFGPTACEADRTAEVELVCNSELAILYTHPKTIEFGYVPLGDSETVEIAVANQGTLDLVVLSDPSMDSPVEGVFTIVNDAEHPSIGGETIEMGNAKIVAIRFQPAEATYYHGALLIETNDSQRALEASGTREARSTYRIPLIGRGIFECPTGYTHQGKSCIKTNDNGVVTGCIPGARKCSDEGEAFQVCNDDGLGWGEDQFCENGMECIGGSCLWQLCEPGARRCAGVVEYTCLESGMEYNDGTICRDSNYCTEDTCEWGKVPSCQYLDVSDTLCDDSNGCTAHVCDPLEGCLLDETATAALNDTPLRRPGKPVPGRVFVQKRGLPDRPADHLQRLQPLYERRLRPVRGLRFRAAERLLQRPGCMYQFRPLQIGALPFLRRPHRPLRSGRRNALLRRHPLHRSSGTDLRRAGRGLQRWSFLHRRHLRCGNRLSVHRPYRSGLRRRQPLHHERSVHGGENLRGRSGGIPGRREVVHRRGDLRPRNGS